jgi:hypothetical protein
LPADSSRCTSAARSGRSSGAFDEVERRAAIKAYREAHPLYSRMILLMLVRVNRFEGDPEEAVVRQLPMLGLRRVGS